MRPLDFLGRIKVKLGIVIVLAVGTAFVVNEVGLNSGLSREVRIAVAVVLALIMVQLLAMGMTKPLRQMASAAQTIAKGRYGLRVTATSRDEVGELARAFNAMAADLGEVDRQRRELIANVSHELRTPITGLRAVLENVVDGVSAPDPVTMRTALSQTERLGRLVAQLLDLSRLDSGVRLIEPEPIELAPLLEQAVREASLAREDVAIRPSAPADLVVRADPDLLAQVLANLLDNAVRHSPPDGVVTVSALPEGDGVRLTVADRGPGIPLSARARVFERFSRLDTGRAADSGGAGLGLAIVKEIVELHGGSIRIDEGAGCRMVVDLPGRTTMADVPLEGERGTGDDRLPSAAPAASLVAAADAAPPKEGTPIGAVPAVGHLPADAAADTGAGEAGLAAGTGAGLAAGTGAGGAGLAAGTGAGEAGLAAGDEVAAGLGAAAGGSAPVGVPAVGLTSGGASVSESEGVASGRAAGADATAGLAALAALATASAPGTDAVGVASSGGGAGVVSGGGGASVASSGNGAGVASSGGGARVVSGGTDEVGVVSGGGGAGVVSGGGSGAGVVSGGGVMVEPALAGDAAGAALRGGAVAPALAPGGGAGGGGVVGPPPTGGGFARMIGGGIIGLLIGFLVGLFAAVLVSVTVGDGLALVTFILCIAFMGAVGAALGAGSGRRAAAAAYQAAQVAAYQSMAQATGYPPPTQGAGGPAAQSGPSGQAQAHGAGLSAQQVGGPVAHAQGGPVAHAQGGPSGQAQAGGSAHGQAGSAAYGQAGGSAHGQAGSAAYGQAGGSAHGQAGSAAYGQAGGSAHGQAAHAVHGQAAHAAHGPYRQQVGPPPYVPPPLFPRPQLPEPPRWLLPAAAGAGVFAAVALPDAQVGLGIVLVSMVLGAAALPAVMRRMTPWTVAFGVTAYFLISMAAVRDADWLVAILLVAGAGLGALAVSGAGAGWLGVIRGGVSVLLAALGPVAWFLAEPFKRMSPKRRVMPALATLGITAVLLLVFGLLFASADAVFASFVERLTTAPDWADSAPLRIFLFVLFAVLLAAVVLVALRPVIDPVGPDTKFRVSRSLWMVPLTAVNLLFALFVAVQITALFGGNAWVLKTAGLTYAEYARQGFFQLVVVSVFVLGIVAVAGGLLKVERRERLLLALLLGVLCGLTMVVLASALHRMNLYTDAYGLSRLRLSVQATVWWLGALFALVLLAGAARLLGRGSGWLPRTVVLVTGLSLGAFALVNPDLQVARTQVEVRGVTKMDSDYLGDLGAEAVPALDRLPEPQRSCVLADVVAANGLNRPDPWNGWNLDRARAREVLAARPIDKSAQCSPAYSRGSD
ncbi:DUF4153 domain-containing protein [Nonomuraea sp. NPDC050786]|uniref:DUF4153 domain-containing protein n=1 Tax=Nonomuraea sp. NPDC050786 TaxID=3154840 RepID=UPI0033C1CC02